ncbi:unnamed protein product, partial [Onchocerca ochengi]|uniref:Integrase catalytic domain-containing protein n=1 Tax=Onchocerca ochengi TaxID=42157 RepID=A0A182EVS9_ONCOC
MQNYPESRIKPSRTFARIGLDYLGPITVKTKIGSKKRWIALFSCFTTRAVHLELVDDLTAESFLNVLRGFVARQGYPELILSDNVSQFQCVENRRPSVGEVVLINDPRTPRGIWILAKIIGLNA